jgi:hypothetical protein
MKIGDDQKGENYGNEFKDNMGIKSSHKKAKRNQFRRSCNKRSGENWLENMWKNSHLEMRQTYAAFLFNGGKRQNGLVKYFLS